MQRFISLIFIASITFGFMGCGGSDKKNEDRTGDAKETAVGLFTLTKDQFKNGNMTWGTMEEKAFPGMVQANGMLDVPPENKVVVSATMGGYIKNTPLLIGDFVKKGQPLVTIENPAFVTLQQQYMEVKQQLVYLQAEYERHKIMMDENITSQKSFLKAESEYQTANARYNGLQKQMEMLNISPSKVGEGKISSLASIYAPITGSVTNIYITKGTYVSPASPIMEIIDNDHIHLELSVFEKDIMKVQKGQPIWFKIPEASKDTFSAKVYLIGTSIGEKRTIRVHGHLEDESKSKFLTGMFVEASIVTENLLDQALPTESIVNVDGHNYVLVLEMEKEGAYTLRQTMVKIGKSYDGYTQIIADEALPVGSKIVTKGAFNLIGE